MANHDVCPVDTIIDGAFNNQSGIPAEVRQGVLECENCFLHHYGDHLTESQLLHGKYRVSQNELHLKHCQNCQQRKEKLAPNKMGSSHPRYRQEIGIPG